jgi:molybdopterin-guanine dinucleotide biosynthesis protein A
MTNLGQSERNSLRAAILAGGKSSRMGEDKALLRLMPHGPTLLETTIQRVSIVVPNPIIVAPSDRDYGRLGVDVIPDDQPNQGVLGGILTALRHFAGDDVLVVACDHPFLNVELLRQMASIDADCDVVIPRTRTASRQGGPLTLQTLHAVYRSTCRSALEEVLERGYASAMAFFDRVRVLALDEDELRGFDPDLASLMSVNTPESLALARAMAAERADCPDGVDYTQ